MVYVFARKWCILTVRKIIMFFLNRQLCVGGIIVTIVVMGMTQVSCARTMLMEVVQEEFAQKTGRRWPEATIEEKRDFIQEYHKREEDEIWEGREREYLPQTATQTTEAAYNALRGETLEVRTVFRARKGKDWDEATQEEQKEFLAEFRSIKAQEEERYRAEREAEKQRREARESQRQAEKQRREEVRRAEEARKLAEKERLKAKRESERGKMQGAMERLQQLQEQQ